MYSRIVRFFLPLILAFAFVVLGVSLLLNTPAKAQPTFDCSTVTEIPQAECEALVALYNTTDGPNWNYTDWLLTNTPCDWIGVTCTSDSVRYLILSENNLSGSVPPEIGNLSNLLRLNLHSNQITSLPSEFGNLSSLEILYLYENQLPGLPPEFGNLSSLEVLYLYKNQLTSLPPEFGNLSSLDDLDLYENKLTSLPPEFGNLTNLTKLYLSNNQLTSLPPEFGNLSNLSHLSLRGNLLISLPAEFGNLSSLEVLFLYENQLTSLPPEFGDLSSLTHLYSNFNQLTSLPPEFGNLSSLEVLLLYENQLTSLPPEIGGLSSLESMSLFDNQLTNLPPEIGTLPSLERLSLHDNPLNGSMPISLTSLINLDSFYFYNTSWCVPDTQTFNDWLASIEVVRGTGFVCGHNPGAISGTVVNINGEPLTDTQVTLYRDVSGSWYTDWEPVTSAAVDDNGEYIIGDLGQDIVYRAYFEVQDGHYAPEYYDNVKSFELATPITVTLNITRTDINAVLERQYLQHLPIIVR